MGSATLVACGGMWIVRELRTEPRSYDFESSGRHDDVALLADGRTLANMLGQVDWSSEPVQLELCTDCGYRGCAQGRYVAPRRIGDWVVMLPSVRGYSDGGDKWEVTQYEAPTLLRSLEAPLIAGDEWDRLRQLQPGVPPLDTLKPMRWAEARLLAQFEAPQALFGKPGGLASARLSTLVLAVDPPLSPDELDRLGDLRAWSVADDAEVSLVALDQARPYLLTLDGTFEEVALFGAVEGRFGLCFKPGLVLLPAAPASGGTSS